jgi:hypothetical protein
MKLTVYRRHRLECESRKPEDSRSSEREERRKGWGRKCLCHIHLSGTLDRKFSRKATGFSDWLEARRIAEAYEKADSWTGKSKVEPVIPDPAPAKSRVTIAEACQVFTTNRESAGLAPATLRKYRTFRKADHRLRRHSRLRHARPDHRGRHRPVLGQLEARATRQGEAAHDASCVLPVRSQP